MLAIKPLDFGPPRRNRGTCENHHLEAIHSIETRPDENCPVFTSASTAWRFALSQAGGPQPGTTFPESAGVITLART